MSSEPKNIARNTLWLIALFLLALIPRLYSANTVGWDWDYPGSFTLINFDEGGSCRAALNGFDYSTMVGRQTIAIAEALGYPPDPGIEGNSRAARQYCHSAGHIQVARNYAAVTGSLTVVLVAIMALLLVPGKPEVAWTAAAILALSGFHVGESHSGTVDAPLVFYIYAFLTLLIYALKSNNRWALAGSLVLLVFAIWAKYWVFATAAYLALVPTRIWAYLFSGFSPARLGTAGLAAVVLFALTSNAAFQRTGLSPLLLLFYVFIPWRQVSRGMIPFFLLIPVCAIGLARMDVIAAYTTSALEGNLGTSYAAIGWNKWIRNPANVVAVLVVGLGLPACAFIPLGLRTIFRDRANARLWGTLAPIALCLVFMMFISPVTYYRHYLALIPAAAMIAAIGLWSTGWPRRSWFLLLFFLWPTLLMVDLELDYQNDPRVALRDWYQQHPGRKVYISYYVSPPPGEMIRSALFRPEYALEGGGALQQADYLVLSENWYDTAFANELNGPYVGRPERLIKTRPEYVRFYRQALSGMHPDLRLEQAIDVRNFMPELLVHSWLYGSFTLFVGDLKIYRVQH